ncbi:hypothetical protein SAE01_39960 [Segetibacter aerophilus]|uniref:Uncharacterized protein n=1 Tax=Segetibacter aerophilus TaxID=670293 RepID=A0A512BHR8_9BACT|nr:hypothetical protein SAE01_39960 [Segetibacter aerophilus]
MSLITFEVGEGLRAKVEKRFLNPAKNSRNNNKATFGLIKIQSKASIRMTIARYGKPKARNAIGEKLTGLIYGVKQPAK